MKRSKKLDHCFSTWQVYQCHAKNIASMLFAGVRGEHSFRVKGREGASDGVG